MKFSYVWMAVVLMIAAGFAGCASDKQPETIDVASRIAQARAQYDNPAVSAGPAPTAVSAVNESTSLPKKSYIK